MKTGAACNRTVICIDGSESIRDAARLMREHHVGDLVITRWQDDRRVPTGVVTDRDLVLEVMAMDLDSDAVAIGDIFASPRLVTAGVDDELEASVHSMRIHGVRRVPVIERDGSLAGIITMDDVLGLLAQQLSEMAGLIDRQTEIEARRRTP